MAITWRNIDAPNFSGAQQGIAAASNTFDKAVSGLADIGQRQQDIATANAATQSTNALTNLKSNILEGTQTSEQFDAFDFAGVAAQQQGLSAKDKSAAFDYFAGREQDVLNQEAKELGMQSDKLNIKSQQNALAKEAKQLDKDRYLESAQLRITGMLQDGMTMEQIKSSMGDELAKGKYATDVYSYMDKVDKARSGLTFQQQKQADHLNLVAKTNYESGIADLDMRAKNLDQLYPVDQKLTPTMEVKSLSDTLRYAATNAPEQGWYPSWDSRAGAEGEELRDYINEDIEDVTESMQTLLKDPKYTIPPQAIQLAVEAMGIDDSKEMNTDTLKLTILDYAKRMRQNDVNIKKKMEANTKIRDDKKALTKTYQDTSFNIYDNVKNLTPKP